jgi:hypothetical protein
MEVRHEFETTQGDELAEQDLRNASWKVVETYVDIDPGMGGLTDVETIVFTHRIEVHSLDDLAIGGLEGG